MVFPFETRGDAQRRPARVKLVRWNKFGVFVVVGPTQQLIRYACRRDGDVVRGREGGRVVRDRAKRSITEADRDGESGNCSRACDVKPRTGGRNEAGVRSDGCGNASRLRGVAETRYPAKRDSRAKPLLTADHVDMRSGFSACSDACASGVLIREPVRRTSENHRASR